MVPFSDEINITLNKVLLKYESTNIMGDLNIDTNTKGIKTDKPEELCNVFKLKKIIKSEICYT